MPPFLAWPAFQEGLGFTLICIVDFAGIALLFVIGLPVWAESSFSPADAWNIFVVAGGGVAFWTLLAATIQHYLMRPQLVPVCGYCGRRSPENMPICPRCTNRV